MQGVTYRVELVVEAEKVEYVAGSSGDEAPRRARPHASSCATTPTSRSRPASTRATALPVGARVDGPAIIREGLSTTFVCPGQIADVGALGELVDPTRGIVMALARTTRTSIRELDERGFAAAFRCDRFTATVLANRFGYIVEHMCSQAADDRLLADPARLLRLRRHDHRAAERRLPDARGEQQHRALHRAR